MSRLAVLVEASKIRGCDELPGARADVAKYRAFLESDIGGAWNSHEIITLSHPSKRELNDAIRKATFMDFAFVNFSGHGHHVVGGKDIDETRLCINDNEEVSVESLNPGNGRSLIIADACRKVTSLELLESAQAYQLSLNARMSALRPNRQRCRNLFDSAISLAEKGPIFMYSCDLDEAAGESKDGGYFSMGMLEAGKRWGENRKTGVLGGNQAFEYASEVVTAKNRQQNPQMNAGRRRTHFPFSVFSA